MATPNVGQQQWGTTPPLSTTPPTDADLRQNESLVEELKKRGNYESTENTEKRKRVLEHLQAVTIEFVKKVARKKSLPQSVIDHAGGLVSTFGSYRLGVFGPGSDIDTCVICPKHVTREDFFEYFIETLREKSPAGAIDEVVQVPDTHVPIIKLHYSKIDLDVIFVPLRYQTVNSDTDLKDNDVLRGLDEVDLRSFNGTRVSDQMLGLVPQTRSFRLALRAVKLWAKNRGIYGAVFGYPGGVAWALLVARICQWYPYACGSTIVNKFFYVLTSWGWPQPIMLKQIEDGPLQARVWNPKIYPGDKRHLMPIITPAYPSMCSTHNITPSTKKVIISEFKRAKEITQNIDMGKKQWSDLFGKTTFFSTGYKHYLAVNASTRSKEAQVKWSGYVQSRVRRLVTGIETSDAGIEFAHPYPSGFERVHHCTAEEQVDKVLQGSMEFKAGETSKTDESNALLPETGVESGVDGVKADAPASGGTETTSDGKKIIYTNTWYIGLELPEGGKQFDISFPSQEFRRVVFEWPDYVPELHTMRLIYVRNYDLPADVFGSHETRPTKKAKKTSKKRSAGTAGLQDATNGVKRPATAVG